MNWKMIFIIYEKGRGEETKELLYHAKEEQEKIIYFIEDELREFHPIVSVFLAFLLEGGETCRKNDSKIMV